MTTAAVFGTGSWGTAFSAVLADAGTHVRMWGRRPEVAQINAGSNEDYLPGIRLPQGIAATTDAARGGAGARHRRPRRALTDPPGQPADLVLGAPRRRGRVLMKGVELGTTRRMSEVIAEVGDIAPERIVVVSGPTSHARSR